MWIERKYEKTLIKLALQFPAVVVTGARQTGKTSLVKRVFPGYNYIALDIPAIAAQAETNTVEFFKTYPEPLIMVCRQKIQSGKLYRSIKK